MPLWLGLSLTSPLTKTDRSGGMAVFAGSDGSISKITSVLPQVQLGGKTSANGELCSVLG